MGTFFGLGEIEANKNETPFYPHFHARMPKFRTEIELIMVRIWKKQGLSKCSHSKSFQRAALILINEFINY